MSNLPKQERQSLLSTEIATTGLPQGTYDEAAHADFATLPATMVAGAERKADIARVLVSAGKGLSWADKAALVARQFGDDGVSKASLMRIAKAVEGVGPITLPRRWLRIIGCKVHHPRLCLMGHGRSS